VNTLYCTADEIGIQTGGGIVTKHESLALSHLGTGFHHLLEKKILDSAGPEPWKWDATAAWKIKAKLPLDLVHFYSGTFGDTVHALKQKGTKVCYTIAAHDKQVSKQEHEKMGWPFPYPHLTDPDLWQRYIRGYKEADVIICPGSVPADTVRKYGKDFENKRIEIIPHGCDIPENVTLIPQRFVVGYCGAIGPDKGVRYLLEAWKRLNYTDALLCIAGRESTIDLMKAMYQQWGGGPTWFAGWVPNISDFYNQISLYVQPSSTEGFGLEVIEAMAHARPVLCSKAAGACDLVPEEMRFNACDPRDLAYKIDVAKKQWDMEKIGLECREVAKECSWEKIQTKYQAVWKSMF